MCYQIPNRRLVLSQVGGTKYVLWLTSYAVSLITHGRKNVYEIVADAESASAVCKAVSKQTVIVGDLQARSLLDFFQEAPF